jgi:hypothetical protein
MVAAQYAPAPSRRKRGGLPAGCSATVLVCLLSLAPCAHGAGGPAPDPVPNVQPDAAPVRTTHTQQPSIQQPAAQAPTATSEPAAQQPTPVRQQPTTTPSTVVSPQPRPSAHRAASRTVKHRAARRHRARSTHSARPAPVNTYGADHALAGVRRVTRLLAFEGPRVTARQSVSDSQLVAAAAALLLFVAAAASVLRISTRIAGGRVG